MDESSKIKLLLGHNYFKKYLNGKVLDIGCGSDPISKDAACFDLEHGDANKIDEYFSEKSFDCVYSSHCLEHMKNPFDCIKKWFALVKDDGFMIIIIPDGNLYEQNIFPSIFNKDHKNIFYKDSSTLIKGSVSTMNLIKSLDKYELIKFEIHDNNYNYRFKLESSNYRFKLHWRIQKVLLFFNESILKGIVSKFIHFLVKRRIPIDQTLGTALAQQCFILKKIKKTS